MISTWWSVTVGIDFPASRACYHFFEKMGMVELHHRAGERHQGESCFSEGLRGVLLFEQGQGQIPGRDDSYGGP